MNDDHTGLLMTFIDAHREAERTRKLWARIWVILGVTIGAYALGGWYSVAHAQTAPAYPGCRLAWDYTWTVPGDGFPVQVDGKWVAKIPQDAREVTCAQLKLTDGPHRVEVRAKAADGRVSPWAGIDVLYSSVMPDPLPPPDAMRIIMEWGVQGE